MDGGQIVLDGIGKSFVVSRRRDGSGVIGGLFRREKHQVRALRDISFSIGRGELVGYIGPNGAGKSTTVKVMSGILTPEQGSCSILGRTPWKDRVAHVAHIGVVFGQRSQLWWDVPVSDSLELLRDIYGLPQAEYEERLKELSQTLDLEPLLRVPVRQLSLGQRMRCEVAAALLHSPEILFLDEPTIGLDAVSKLALREFLKKENREHGVTMILTTHDMDDVEALCSRVMTIGHGRLLYDGNLEEMRERYSPFRRLRMTLREPVEAVQVAEAESCVLEGQVCTVLFDPRRIPSHALVASLSERYPLRDVTVGEQDVDEMIASMYRELRL